MRGHLRRVGRCSIWVFVLCAAIASDAQAPDPDQHTKAQVRAALDDYIRFFSQKRADLLSTQVFSSPTFRMEPGGFVPLMTAADASAYYESQLADLPADYDRSEVRSANICVFNENAALVGVDVVRYRKDNSVLLNVQATYLFGKTEKGWRVVAHIGHSASKMLQCSK